MADTDSYVPEASLTALILTLSSSAWVSLGKVTDPVSGEIKMDLKGAKYSIDLLIMMRAKTKGNLTADEEKLLNALISDLQANYSETVFSQQKPEGAEKSPSEKVSSSNQKEAEGETTAQKGKREEQGSKEKAPSEQTKTKSPSSKEKKEERPSAASGQNAGKKGEEARKNAKESNSKGGNKTK